MKKSHYRAGMVGATLLVFTALSNSVSAAIVPGCDGPTCSIADLFTLGNGVVNFFFLIMIPLAAVMFAWAGFNIMFSGGDSGRYKKGIQMMKGTIYGMLFMMFAWMAVSLLKLVLGV